MTDYSIKQTKSGDITIRLPASFLRHLTKTHPELDCDGRVIVRNTKALSDDILAELERDTGEEGLSPIQLMVDAAILSAVENGSAAVDVIEGED